MGADRADHRNWQCVIESPREEADFDAVMRRRITRHLNAANVDPRMGNQRYTFRIA
jgi:hypothetical protein